MMMFLFSQEVLHACPPWQSEMVWLVEAVCTLQKVLICNLISF